MRSLPRLLAALARPLSLAAAAAAPVAARTAAPGDLVVQSISATNSVCVYRPDGAPVACSAGAPTDWWVGVALTPELGWVTTNLTSTGYELLRFDAHGSPIWSTGLPQLWQVPDLEVAPDGTLVLLDFPIESMQLYDLFGNHQGTVHLGTGFAPNELEVTPDGELWMASGPDVRRYDVAGNVLAQFAVGFQPASMSLAPDGSLWFVVAGSPKLRHRAPDGTKLPSIDLANGDPSVVAAAPDGTLWVTTLQDQAVHLDETGQVLTAFSVPSGVFRATVVLPGGEIGAPSCGPAAANSTGAPGELTLTGRAYAELNELVLHADQLPAQRFGLFLASQTPGQSQPPGSQGTLCLAGNLGRFRAQVASTGSAGALELAADLSAIPTTPPSQVLAGETWHFQAWFRDANPGATSNFTDARAVTFQ